MSAQTSLDPVETLAQAILDRSPQMQRYLQERRVSDYDLNATEEARAVAKSLLDDAVVYLGQRDESPTERVERLEAELVAAEKDVERKRQEDGP